MKTAEELQGLQRRDGDNIIIFHNILHAAQAGSHSTQILTVSSKLEFVLSEHVTGWIKHDSCGIDNPRNRPSGTILDD